MIIHRARGLRTLHLCCQCLIASSAFWIWIILFRAVYDPAILDNLRSYLAYSFVICSSIIVRAVTTRKQGLSTFINSFEAQRETISQTGFAAGFVLLYLVATKDILISRLFLFSFLMVAYPILLISNRFLPAQIARLVFRKNRTERVLLVGSMAKAESLQNWLFQKEDLGLRVIGLATNDQEKRITLGIPILGTQGETESIIQKYDITQILLLELSLSNNALSEITSLCETLGVRLLVFSDLESKFRHAITYIEDDGQKFITLRGEPLEDPFNRILKRCLDIVVSIPVVVLLLPFTTLLVWFVQRIQSPGPVFYLQIRAGLQNRPFTILKYRTMHVNNPDSARQASRTDSRIYPAGLALRKYSIDELPQFLNVLLGDMSVVGPRPHLEEHNEQFAQTMKNYHIRALVKPGITGLAQIRGFRGETTTDEAVTKRVEADIHYLENWSFTGDCLLIAKTVFHVISPPPSAY